MLIQPRIADVPAELIDGLSSEFDYPYSGQWVAYANWLRERGHPLGDVISAELEQAFNPEVEPWLLPTFRRGLERGGLGEPREYCFDAITMTRYGYHRSLWINPSVDIAKLLASESVRFLGKANVENSCAFLSAIANGSCELSYLEELHLDGKIDPQVGCTTASMPRLRFLSLFGAGVTSLSSASLEVLVMRAEAMNRFELRLPNLTELCLFSTSEATRTPYRLEPILAAYGLPKLQRLDLSYLATDEICAALAESPLAPQLEELNLIRGLNFIMGKVKDRRCRRCRHLCRLRNAQQPVFLARGPACALS